MEKIKVGIVGYGNLGKGAEIAVNAAQDMELAAVFTRRDPAEIKIKTAGASVEHIDNIAQYKGKIDVMVLCGGSATDLPVQGPLVARLFNTVDSFDNHSHIPQYIADVERAALEGGTTAAVSIGWDPGLFSYARAIFGAILPDGNDYTFWGRGVSQGHGDALRRIEGVADAVQYTVPVSGVIDSIIAHENPVLTARDKHTRECYIVLKEGADAAAVERAAKTMPDYFEPYNTTVTFISQAELDAQHKAMPHGGNVIRTGATAAGSPEANKHMLMLKLELGSNPQFTSSIMVMYARAVCRFAKAGRKGAFTALDFAPADLTTLTREQLLKII